MYMLTMVTLFVTRPISGKSGGSSSSSSSSSIAIAMACCWMMIGAVVVVNGWVTTCRPMCLRLMQQRQLPQHYHCRHYPHPPRSFPYGKVLESSTSPAAAPSSLDLSFINSSTSSQIEAWLYSLVDMTNDATGEVQSALNQTGLDPLPYSNRSTNRTTGTANKSIKTMTSTISWTNKELEKLLTLLDGSTMLDHSKRTKRVDWERLWAAILKVCVVLGNDTAARHVLEAMSARGQRPNVYHCTAYLKVLVRMENKIDEAVAFLQLMASDGAVLSTSSFSRGRYSSSRVSTARKRHHGDHHAPTVASEATAAATCSSTLLVSAPDIVAVKTVLIGCAQHYNFTAARHVLTLAKEGLLGLVVQQGVDEQCYNIVLSSCRDDALAAKELVREMRLSRRHRVGVIPPSAVTLTKALVVCRKAKDVETARFFLKLARNDGIEVNVLMYSAAIWTAVQANDCLAALEFFRDLKRAECVPSIAVYNGVMAALSASSTNSGGSSGQNAERAVAVFREMKQEHPDIHSDYATFTHLTTAIRKVSVEEEQIALLWRVYALMGPRERRANVGGRLLEAFILAYGGLGHFEEAMSVFESINGPSNAECLRAILFACSFADPPEWETALALLHSSDIVEGGEGPALVEPGALCNAMLACSKANEWQESLQLFRLYGGKNLSKAAVNSLIASCGRTGRPDMAIQVLDEMHEKGIEPDVRSYRNAIIACNQAEHVFQRLMRRALSQSDSDMPLPKNNHWWERACVLLERMKQSGLVPDTPTLSSAISACEAAGRWQVALEVLQCALDEEAQASSMDDPQRLNLYCFNAALAACEKGGAWVEAIEIYEKMKDHGGGELQPNIVTMNSLLQALDAAGQKEIAMSTYEEGIRMNFFKSPWRFTAESASGDHVNALDLHSFSAAMSRAAIRSHLESMLLADSPLLKEDLTIIVGKGLRSQDAPVLKRATQLLLQSEFGVEALVDDHNTGRLVVTAAALESFVANRSWR